MPESPGAQLRALLQAGTVVMPACYDGLSAAVLEEAGFPAIGVSGAGLAMSQLGVPDLGLLTLTELVTAARHIIARAGVPVMVDADTGFGGALNVVRTVKELTAAGAAAIQIEDQVAPKRCGHLMGKDVVATSEFEERIRAAALARGASEVLIVARTDALAVHGVEDAIARAARALDAGADVTFVEAPTTLAEVERIARALPGPKMYNLAAGGRSPALTVSQLRELGYSLVVVPTVALYAAVDGIRRAARELLRQGSDDYVATLGMSPSELFEVVGLTRWLELDERVRADGESG
jgi:2-methylisocitrate lyase-like PEP mutase family enzyme